MAKKRVYQYTVVFTTVGGTTLTAMDSDGLPFGTIAYQNLIHHETVLVKTATIGDSGLEITDTYIPFDSIDHAVVTKTVQLVDYEDTNCAVSAEENPGG